MRPLKNRGTPSRLRVARPRDFGGPTIARKRTRIENVDQPLSGHAYHDTTKSEGSFFVRRVPGLTLLAAAAADGHEITIAARHGDWRLLGRFELEFLGGLWLLYLGPPLAGLESRP